MFYFITALILSCDKFYGEISHHGYTIERVLTDADSNGNALKNSLDQTIPLIICSCSECKLPRKVAELLEGSSMPDSWNILQLRQIDNRNPLQCNERIKVTYTDVHDDIPMGEVLDWLQTKVCTRSTNLVNGQDIVNRTEMNHELLQTDNENENTT